MKEHEFKCRKCGSVWYATDKDIRESRKQQANIQRAKLQNASGFRGKKYTKRSAEIARMQETQDNQDPNRCPKCGSREIEIDGNVGGSQSSGVSLGQKLLIALAIVFLPFVAIVFSSLEEAVFDSRQSDLPYLLRGYDLPCCVCRCHFWKPERDGQ